MKKINSDESIIDFLKGLDPRSNASLFVHVDKEFDKNYISYFIEANMNDLSTIIMQLMNEPGFRSSVYLALLTLFQNDEKEKEYFKNAIHLMDTIDLTNMN